jgi:hypothetical protein
MSMLMRAPRECATWEWELSGFASPGLDSALAVAAQMSNVLRKHGLLEPQYAEWQWIIFGRGGLGVITKLSLRGNLDVEGVSRRVREARPAAFPQAEPNLLHISGPGTWLDAEGTERREYGLVDLIVDPSEHELTAEVSVFHDIWGHCDFKGVPHPEVEKRNAPRLAAALRELEGVLDRSARPGDPTYFGRADGYGVQMPELIDGLGPDLTDQL